ncbi:MAG: rhodanese-like domain-containing protein, partial [Candidatus Sumerlaeota bacterium]
VPTGDPQFDIGNTGTQIIIYCDGGDCDASHKVQTMLGQFGLNNTIVFDDGFPGWEKAGLEIETGDPATP